MLAEDFVRILKTFADNPTDIDISKGTVVVQVRDELLEARLSQKAGMLYVQEDGIETLASDWVIRRVARVAQLADRILSYVKEPEHFVTPSGRLQDQPDYASGSEDKHVHDAASTMLDVLGRRPGGTSSVLYLTSDAGEGKTTLINHLARQQALAYKERRTDWLLIPIPLGGRAFLRFDDVVIAALVNRLRVQWLYYEAFIELVRLGVVVPAFDGFEEMFIEGSSGEALSALGTLMRNLRSSGTTLIAARKAYFEYQSLRTQAKLFDAIGSDSVSFARLALNRWERNQFITYAQKRRTPNPEAIYDAVASRLSDDHPILTRAVLVRRLLDVVRGLPQMEGLLKQLGSTPRDYFFQFVNAIIEREAREKWLSKSSEAQEPLLSIEEHHELLCMLAQEMWLSSSDSLKAEVLDVLADMFAEQAQKAPVVARQIKERLKQHSLVTAAESVRDAFSFDHEDFQKFFLGEAIGNLLRKKLRNDLHAVMAVAALPKEACDHAVHCLRRLNGSFSDAFAIVQEVSSAELPTSFVRENAGALSAWLLDGAAVTGATAKHMNFPPDALCGKRFSNLTFVDCYFQPTSLEHASLAGCHFKECRFERLEVESRQTHVGQAYMEHCEVGSLVRGYADDQLFDPISIVAALETIGFKAAAKPAAEKIVASGKMDEQIRLFEKVLRIYLRTTQVNENVISVRLGGKASTFFGNVLPALLRANILEEVPYLGAGSQRRFKLAVPMQRLQDGLTKSQGNFQKFLQQFSEGG